MRYADYRSFRTGAWPGSSASATSLATGIGTPRWARSAPPPRTPEAPMTDTDFSAHLRAEPEPAELGFTGDVDIRTITAFRQAIGLAATCYRRFVVDLSDTHFLCAAGVGVLHDHGDRITALLVGRH